MKIGIDIGNYAVKTSKGISFKSAVTLDSNFGNSNDVLILNEKKYYIGEGAFEIDFIKFKKENYIPLLVTSICKSTYIQNTDIELGLGLPINQFKTYKDELIRMLEGRKFECIHNEDEFRLTISKVNIFPEGVAGYIANYNEHIDFVGKRDVIVVDIGGKTTDIALLQNNKVINNSTINYGTIDIYNTIKLELEKNFTDVKIPIDKVEDYIKLGFYYKNNLTDISFAIKKASNIYKEIYNELKLNYPINTEAVILSGGGSYLLGNIFKSKISLEIDGDIFANAKGYEKLLK